MYLLLLILHLALLILGRTWFLSTLLFYPMLGIIIYWLIKVLRRKFNKQNLKNCKYKIIIIICIILVTDFSLRIFTDSYKSYSEKNYGWIYISPYTNGYDLLKNRLSENKNKNILTHTENSSYVFKTKDFAYTHTYNNLGLREKNIDPKIIADKIVILTIGDSFTEGVGTHQDSTWQRILEKKLNDSSQNDYFVINAGISGHDPNMSIKLFKDLDNIYNPEYVILSISENDIYDFINRSKTDFSETCVIKRQPLSYYFYSWSYIFRATSSLIFDYPELCINMNKYQELEQQAYVKMNKEIQNLINYSQKTNCQLIIISFPDLLSCQNLKYNKDAFATLINDLKSNNKIITIDILEFYQQSKNSFTIPSKYLYWPTDGHMTPLGYRMWAEITFSNLFEHNFL